MWSFEQEATSRLLKTSFCSNGMFVLKLYLPWFCSHISRTINLAEDALRKVKDLQELVNNNQKWKDHGQNQVNTVLIQTSH